MTQQFALIGKLSALSNAFSDVIFHLLNLDLNHSVTLITSTYNHTQLNHSENGHLSQNSHAVFDVRFNSLEKVVSENANQQHSFQ